MTTSCLVALPCAVLFAAGCISSPSTAPPTDARAPDAIVQPDGASDGAPPLDGGVAEDASPEAEAAVCNDLADDAPAISVGEVAADPPAAQGGSIVDGTYWLTTATIYTGPNGAAGAIATGQTTIRVTGSAIEVAASGQPASRTVSFTTTGTSITATDTCPDTSIAHGSYTATATTLVVELPAGTDDAGPKTLVETFTKQ